MMPFMRSAYSAPVRGKSRARRFLSTRPTATGLYGACTHKSKFADRPVQFRNTSLGGSATVRSNRLACVVGERTEVILEIFTILTHQPKHLSGSDDAAAQRLRRH